VLKHTKIKIAMKNKTYDQKIWINLIEDAFNEKRGKNKAYSYRAFSRDLAVSQSLLSKLLTGKRKVTPEIGLRVALGLELSNDKIVELMVSTLQSENNFK
jgi:hypothetical protein